MAGGMASNIENRTAGEYKRGAVASTVGKGEAGMDPGQLSGVFNQIKELDNSWPKGKKKLFRKPLQGFFQEADFLGP